MEAARLKIREGVHLEAYKNPKPTEVEALRASIAELRATNRALVNLLCADKTIAGADFEAAVADELEAEVIAYEETLARLWGKETRL